MKVSPLDLRQLRFRTAFRGFDRAEVLALVAEVADDYEHALREVDRLHQEISKIEALLNQHREHERDLRDMLVTAQRVSDEIRTNAEAQARHIAPRGRKPFRPAAAEDPGAARGRAARDRRHEDETSRSRDTRSRRRSRRSAARSSSSASRSSASARSGSCCTARAPPRRSRSPKRPMTSFEWVRATPDGISLLVKVIPRAGVTTFAGIRDGRLLVRLAAAPVDDAANDALIGSWRSL